MQFSVGPSGPATAGQILRPGPPFVVLDSFSVPAGTGSWAWTTRTVTVPDWRLVKDPEQISAWTQGPGTLYVKACRALLSPSGFLQNGRWPRDGGRDYTDDELDNGAGGFPYLAYDPDPATSGNHVLQYSTNSEAFELSGAGMDFYFGAIISSWTVDMVLP